MIHEADDDRAPGGIMTLGCETGTVASQFIPHVCMCLRNQRFGTRDVRLTRPAVMPCTRSRSSEGRLAGIYAPAAET